MICDLKPSIVLYSNLISFDRKSLKLSVSVCLNTNPKNKIKLIEIIKACRIFFPYSSSNNIWLNKIGISRTEYFFRYPNEVCKSVSDQKTPKASEKNKNVEIIINLLCRKLFLISSRKTFLEINTDIKAKKRNIFINATLIGTKKIVIGRKYFEEFFKVVLLRICDISKSLNRILIRLIPAKF